MSAADEKTLPPLEATMAPVIPPPAAAVDEAEAPPPAAASAPTMMEYAGSAAATPVPELRPPVARRASTNTDAFLGKEFCGYRIEEKLAEGGMGVVFVGEHTKIGRRAAIKVLKLEFCQNDEVVERFYQEARAVNEIRQENIVDIYDFGRDDDGRVFFVMELLEGEPLSKRLARGPLPWREALPLVEQTVRALKAAHDKGFVHRDLKPDNIWLQKREDGRVQVKLLDFGIAKLVGLDNAKEKLTRTGSVMGTPHYMSPEQIGGESAVDHRTDVYALGVIMYELFTGVLPFQGDSLAKVMAAHLFAPAPKLHDVAPELGVPDGVADVIDRMLAKKPEERYERVTDVLADLKAVAAGKEPSIVTQLERARPQSPITLPSTRPAATAERTAAASPRRSGGKMSPWVYVGGGVALLGAWAVAFSLLRAPVRAPVARPAPAAVPAMVEPPAAAPVTPTAPAVDLEKVRHDAAALLHAALAHAEPRVRVQGTDAVGAVRDDASVPKLIELTHADPDDEVRGHAAGALGVLGADKAAPELGVLEAKAAPPLRVWYAASLARLGDKKARKRLVQYAHDKDLAVAYKAAMALADASRPGDPEAISALTALAAREGELNDIAPYAGAVILTRLVALHHPQARALLYQVLEQKDEGARLAAAEGLARLGDESGKNVLLAVVASEASPNRVVAAVALVRLGDYSGFDLLGQRLGDHDAGVRGLCARGLGEIGEKSSIGSLVPMLEDQEWSVRISAAEALLTIVGLDPKLLAQASIDWARGALDSEDWAVRRAAAGVIGDLPEKEAAPLLARAIADPDANVRKQAARSAGQLHGDEATRTVATAALAERDPAVKEEQVKALGSMGNPAAHDALATLSEDPGRVGVLASGSLIAIGDPAGKERLAAAIGDVKIEVRLAAVEASVLAGNPIVVPTLARGAADPSFEVRFGAAEGLAGYKAETTIAAKVLAEGLDKPDALVQARARVALIALGAAPAGGATLDKLLDSPDAKVRQAVARPASQLAWTEARPVVRRMLADPDPTVRRGALDTLEKYAPGQKDEVAKLYRSATHDADPGNRAAAQGRLAKLTDTVAVAPAAAPAPVVADVSAVQAALDATRAAHDAAVAAKTALDGKMARLSTLVGAGAKDDDDVKVAAELASDVDREAKAIDASASAAQEGAHRAATAAGATPTAQAQALVDDADAQAKATLALATQAHDIAARARKSTETFTRNETGDPSMYLSAGEAALASGNLAEARKELDKAAKAFKGTGNATLEFDYGRLYDKLADAEKNGPARAKLLLEAKKHYGTFAAHGSGPRVNVAKERLGEIDDELAEIK